MTWLQPAETTWLQPAATCPDAQHHVRESDLTDLQHRREWCVHIVCHCMSSNVTPILCVLQDHRRHENATNVDS